MVKKIVVVFSCFESVFSNCRGGKMVKYTGSFLSNDCAPSPSPRKEVTYGVVFVVDVVSRNTNVARGEVCFDCDLVLCFVMN